MNMFKLPDPQQRLPAQWQAYAAWLAAQANPPKSYRAHPIASEAELLALKKDFARHMGLSLGQYVRLKRVQHLLAQNDSSCQAELDVALMQTPLGQMLVVFGEHQFVEA